MTKACAVRGAAAPSVSPGVPICSFLSQHRGWALLLLPRRPGTRRRKEHTPSSSREKATAHRSVPALGYVPPQHAFFNIKKGKGHVKPRFISFPEKLNSEGQLASFFIPFSVSFSVVSPLVPVGPNYCPGLWENGRKNSSDRSWPPTGRGTRGLAFTSRSPPENGRWL